MKNSEIAALATKMSTCQLTPGERDDAIVSAVEFLESFGSTSVEPVAIVHWRRPLDALNESLVRGLFDLAGFSVTRLWRLENGYWPMAYVEERIRSPWWLVKTDIGLIEMGRRRSVFALSWEETPVRQVITADNVTKDETMVHAWSLDKLSEYLKGLRFASRSV